MDPQYVFVVWNSHGIIAVFDNADLAWSFKESREGDSFWIGKRRVWTQMPPVS